MWLQRGFAHDFTVFSLICRRILGSATCTLLLYVGVPKLPTPLSTALVAWCPEAPGPNAKRSQFESRRASELIVKQHRSWKVSDPNKHRLLLESKARAGIEMNLHALSFVLLYALGAVWLKP